MRLKLKRPIVVFDLETTGTDPQNDRIVEAAFSKVYPDGRTQALHYLINPGVTIPAEVTAIHGITNEAARQAPRFSHYANTILDFITGCDLVGFNLIAFDIPVLFFEFSRAGIKWNHSAHHVIDAGNIFKIEEPRTLVAAAKFYLGKDLTDAHSAKADAQATLEVLAGQMERYEHLPDDVESLALHSNHGRRRADVTGKFIVDESGEYVLNFGPNRGRPAKEHLDFLNWMCMRDFPIDALAICDEILCSAGVS